VLLDERDLRLHRRGDVGGDETAGPGADHDEVAIECRGPLPAGVDPAGLHGVEDLLQQERQQPEHDE